jgi:AraC family transcriptional regulator
MHADDVFARFLDALADSLNEPEVSGQTLADRVHLSRFHVDRLVAAVAGEPPGALRRRVLLERAAYRLLTTDHDVLRIAVDAGYASHEAFTRAFTRVYGRPPSRWRHAATDFRIDAPNRVHFHPPGGLRLPAREEVDTMELLTRMVEHHVWLVGQMLDRAAPLPDTRLDMPVEISVPGIDDDPTPRSLLARLVGQLAMWTAAVSGRPYEMAAEAGASVADLRRRLDEAGPAFLALFRDVAGAGRLDETFVDGTCEPPQVFTYGGMIAHVLTFAAYRRTLVCGALADAGIHDLGTGDPMSWVSGTA